MSIYYAYDIITYYIINTHGGRMIFFFVYNTDSHTFVGLLISYTPVIRNTIYYRGDDDA